MLGLGFHLQIIDTELVYHKLDSRLIEKYSEISEKPREEYNTICEDTCKTVYNKECSTHYEDKCHNEYEDKCETKYVTVYGTAYAFETKCKKKCITVYDKVCKKFLTYGYSAYAAPQKQCSKIPHGECQNVPTQAGKKMSKQVARQVCNPVEKKFPKQVAREDCPEEPKEYCKQMPKKVAKQVPEEVCRKIPKKIDKQHCTKVPHEVCHNVPSQEYHNDPKQVSPKGCKDTPKQAEKHKCKEVFRRVCESQPVILVKHKNSRFIKDSASSLMLHCRHGNQLLKIQMFKDEGLAVNKEHAAIYTYELDANLYTCLANTEAGKSSYPAELTVEEAVSHNVKTPKPPNVLIKMPPVTCPSGGSAK